MRRLLLAGAALAGAAAWRSARPRPAEPAPPIPGAERLEYAWGGLRIVASALGSGPPMLLVHSIHAAASSWEWRQAAPRLARQHRVLAPDLLGFGRSERPDIRYSADLYADLIADFTRDQAGAPCVLVANSLGGAHAIMAADRFPDLFRALVLVQPTGMTRLQHENRAAGAVGGVIRTPGAGTAMFDALTSRPGIRYFLRQSYRDPLLVTPEMVDYHHQLARQPGARYAPAAFVGFELNADVTDRVRRLRPPVLLVWGSHPHTNPHSERHAFEAARPDWQSAVVDDTGDLPHDEAPDAFAALVSRFLDQTSAAG